LGFFEICKLAVEILQEVKLMKMSTIEKVQEDILVEEQVGINNEIVLYNDDVNTFDHVIDTLIRVCKHTAEQAEQCAILVHYKGQCTVKTGSFDELKPQCTQLLEAGLSAEII
jgi:ATP-dependent Clp protease adaptor protein ClpS